MTKLLTTNAKLTKNAKDVDGFVALAREYGRKVTKKWAKQVVSYSVLGLDMPPLAKGGHGMDCEFFSPACAKLCNGWYTGQKLTSTVRNAMIWRRNLLATKPLVFWEMLDMEIDQHAVRCREHGLSPVFRLNVTNDMDMSQVAKRHTDKMFYDYCGGVSRINRADWPDNYHLTLSYKETHDKHTIREHLERGGNVAIPMAAEYRRNTKIGVQPVPATFEWDGAEFTMVDGDIHDVRRRELDGEGVFVALRFKGSTEERHYASSVGWAQEVTGA